MQKVTQSTVNPILVSMQRTKLGEFSREINFTFKNQLLLPMWYPLSGIMVCLYFEFLVSSSFKNILPQNYFYFRCIYPENIILSDIDYKRNNIETIIDFTFESNNILLFLNIMTHRTNNDLQAYRKSTNKENRKNLHSHHYQIYHFDRFSDRET